MSDFNHLINTQTFTDFKQFFTAKNLENKLISFYHLNRNYETMGYQYKGYIKQIIQNENPILGIHITHMNDMPCDERIEYIPLDRIRLYIKKSDIT